MVTRLVFKKTNAGRRRDEDNWDGRGSKGFWDVSRETGANGGFGDGAAGTVRSPALTRRRSQSAQEEVKSGAGSRLSSVILLNGF